MNELLEAHLQYSAWIKYFIGEELSTKDLMRVIGVFETRNIALSHASEDEAAELKARLVSVTQAKFLGRAQT